MQTAVNHHRCRMLQKHFWMWRNWAHQQAEHHTAEGLATETKNKIEAFLDALQSEKFLEKGDFSSNNVEGSNVS